MAAAEATPLRLASCHSRKSIPFNLGGLSDEGKQSDTGFFSSAMGIV